MSASYRMRAVAGVAAALFLYAAAAVAGDADAQKTLAPTGKLRAALYPLIDHATRDERTGIAEILEASGGADSVPTLQTLSKDPDVAVASEGLRALRTVQSRQ